MYNEKVKRKFIRYYADTKPKELTCASLFRATAKFERQWGADLCTRTTEELQPMIKELFGINIENTGYRRSILRRYIKWCVDNGVDGAKESRVIMAPIDIDDKVHSYYVGSPLDLQKCLDAVFAKESEETVDNVFRCFFWLAFSGVPEGIVESLTAEHIDFNRKLIIAYDESWEIYNESIPALRNCAELSSFRIYTPQANRKDPWEYHNRADGAGIIRGLSGSTFKFAWYGANNRLTLARKEHKTDKRISYERIQKSGFFYRMLAREIYGYEPDFTAFVNLLVHDKTNARSVQRLELAYKKEYLAWKSVFHS